MRMHKFTKKKKKTEHTKVQRECKSCLKISISQFPPYSSGLTFGYFYSSENDLHFIVYDGESFCICVSVLFRAFLQTTNSFCVCNDIGSGKHSRNMQN